MGPLRHDRDVRHPCSAGSPVLLSRLWAVARRYVPLPLYPLLAPAYRWRRRVQLKRVEADDERHLRAHPAMVAPPAELRFNVGARGTIREFLEGGQHTVDAIERALASVGRSLVRSREFLDFGCGCGRVILALRDRAPGLVITGSDVDGRAIRWCERHLAHGRWVVNDPLPPSPFHDAAFDLIWCGSVFTHLDERRQDLWLRELRRLLKPDGVLLATVHGRAAWESRLTARDAARLRRAGILFARLEADAGIHPDWYQLTWHTEEYVRRHWASILEIRGYLPGAHGAHQDIVIARKAG